MLIVIDGGTSNLKGYLTDTKANVTAKSVRPHSRRSNTDEQGRLVYRRLIQDLVDELLVKANLKMVELEAVIGFGMISSDVGLVVVPHLTAPVSLRDLQQGIYEVDDSTLFGGVVPFYLIRGVKNHLEQERSLNNIFTSDFMRGEETQIMGIIDAFQPAGRCNIIILGSHSKISHIDDSGNIVRCMTTMSGQMYDCIVNNTIVGKSVDIDNDSTATMSLDEILKIAKDTGSSFGFMRTALLPRFMDNFTNMTPRDRNSFLTAAIALEDVKAFHEYSDGGILQAGRTFIVGQDLRSRIFAKAYKTVAAQTEIAVLKQEEIENVAVRGALKIYYK